MTNDNNKQLIGKSAAIVLFVFGILLIIGAVKDWDWLYKPDVHYQHKWTLGQISRYAGRGSAASSVSWVVFSWYLPAATGPVPCSLNNP